MLAGLGGLHIAVANDNKEITVHSGHFWIDCYDLPLGSYDMVLGVRCLESLGPILWDF
jgi:hypothetical protein